MTGTNDLSNKNSVWDWLKSNIRNHAIFYSKEKAKERRIKKESLQTDYQIATKKFEEDPTVSNQNLLNEAKDGLELFYEEKTKGIIIRARARWHEHGERRTKYFLNLEKRNNVKKHIRKRLVSGAITIDPFKILDEQKRFYHNLYKSQLTGIDSNNGEFFLSNLNIPKLGLLWDLKSPKVA